MHETQCELFYITSLVKYKAESFRFELKCLSIIDMLLKKIMNVYEENDVIYMLQVEVQNEIASTRVDI